MAEESVKALVSRRGCIPDVHVAEWAEEVGKRGGWWAEDDGRGLWAVKVLRSPENSEEEAHGALIRPLSAEELQTFDQLQQQADAHRQTAQALARELEMTMRFIAAEMDLRRRYLRLLFTAPGRVDFRELVRKLGQKLKLKIELRQVGPRDEARVLGGLGPCGLGVCCRTFLQELKPIPLEMAFDQQLHFSPGRMTGVCGRLMCCLRYEHQQYLEALADLPRMGSRIAREGREGKVVDVNIFHRTLSVQWDDGDREDLSWDEFNSQEH